jgi:hypothetical protein
LAVDGIDVTVACRVLKSEQFCGVPAAALVLHGIANRRVKARVNTAGRRVARIIPVDRG